ncbi:YeeE/YedE family protein [candidate division KSB1 bacterium]|nr:YeeE/YedE family protein [candidate division KSB1 bacterium]
MIMKKYSFLLFGALFGFILSRAGATTYDFYAKLFLFEHFQLLWVIVTAATLGALGVALLKAMKARTLFEGKPIAFKGKPYKSSLIPGSVLFGLGWGLAGACPGTALAMLGEGKLGALFTLFGVFLGTYLYGLRESKAKAARAVAGAAARVETA